MFRAITWRMALRLLVIAGALGGSPAFAQGTLLRLNCDDDDAGAEISVNGEFKGECPLDMRVPAGSVRIEAIKKIDAQRERAFVQELRVGDGVTKRIDIVLGPVQLNAQGRRLAAEKQRLAQQAQEQAEQVRQAALAAAEQARQQRVEDALAEFKAQGVEPGNGHAARECADCPEMVLVPGTADQPPLAVGKYEVTVDEYTAFARDSIPAPPRSCVIWEDGGLFGASSWKPHPELGWDNPGFAQTPRHPVVCVSWNDAQAYVRWLSRKTGHTYALPTQHQWARADGQFAKALTPPWGPIRNADTCRYGNFFDLSGSSELSKGLGVAFLCKDGFGYTAPVGSFAANRFGLHDLWGNAGELLQDLQRRAPRWAGDEPTELVRIAGFSWANDGSKPAIEAGYSQDARNQFTGMRVVRLLDDGGPAASQRAVQAAAPISKVMLAEADRLASTSRLRSSLPSPPAPGDTSGSTLLTDDDRRANEAYEQAVSAGNAEAAVRLAERYEVGVGAPRDPERAFLLYQKAAQAGLPAGMGGLAGAYFNGTGTPTDRAKALAWARKGTELEDGRSMNMLGLLYGLGVPGQLAADAAQALKWTQRAAAAGDPRAQVNLAGRYWTGKDVAKDEATAGRLYLQAANAGLPAAMRMAGAMYQSGMFGVAQNEQTAALWYGRAAAAGDGASMFSLGKLYDQGQGVEKNPATATAWLSLAADKGVAAARTYLATRKPE